MDAIFGPSAGRGDDGPSLVLCLGTLGTEWGVVAVVFGVGRDLEVLVGADVSLFGSPCSGL